MSVMLITVMQILDTSITNVALPHMQGSLSTSVEETAWVVTSYLAANAIVIPATGWLTGVLGRRRLFLICTTLFTVSSFLSGLAPNLHFLVAMRVLQGEFHDGDVIRIDAPKGELEFVNSAASRDEDDRRGLVEYVYALSTERLEQYLALLTTDGPLVPVGEATGRSAGSGETR